MGTTVVMGWWILPLVGSAVLLGLVFSNVDKGGGVRRLMNAAVMILGIVASLCFWLAWALVLR